MTSVPLIFRQSDGSETPVEVQPGRTVMEAAVMAGIPGIEGECGGSLSCATCHVYAPEGFEAPGDYEADMLDFAESPRRETSRLSCQIKVTPELAGTVFEVPA
ncbi:2Fe-2S iron-sulfur cluster-binding protein [Celeribacter ethanolicus]|uniref:2Fe-2S iron-sulfur cluster-binding protein n=1 Tax=Celeribacter TaxID=875170 RepID=UPI00082DFE68|nr:2Fe-2S iron-sulfur cluster-binding protein [Celeribacter ethanolicus]